MTLTEHLEDLRWCLLKAVLAVVIASSVSYYFSDAIFGFMVAPLRQNLPPGQNLIGTSVTEAFFSELKVALAAGVLFSSPYIFYQVWRFVAPGLSGNERKLVVPFVLCATLFFVGGAYFCYRIVLPVAFKYFIEQYATMGVTPAIRIGEYFTFFFRMVLAFSLTFELPVFTFFLVRLGIWNYRLMISSFRYALIAIFVLAAMLTPTPDVINQSLLALPMLVLYVLSIGVAYVWRRKE
ncbi:MAG: Sec-independent protein translocase protein TatC [Deltaproteobacteria bacterium]|nr:Sec-independent protein translocase protein TatC [Deltaproteobacteria bacterium]